MNRRLPLCSSVAASAFVLLALADPQPSPTKSITPAKVQFARDILPILSANCFTCHGPDEKTRKADLRLDVAEGALKGGKSGTRAIVPGKPAESELVARILAGDRHRMPPAKSEKLLKESDKQLLKRWIEEGAEYQRHWAFVGAKRPPIPEPMTRGWAKNPIDRFVLVRLEQEGLQPSPEADRYTLARRVAIDLTGLPPSPEAVERFINDRGPDAYEKFVDDILKTPAYGERWAAVWLDLARYADSNGYANDNPRTIWRFRDWVIESINANLPYDRFTIEQLAGDLLPGATSQQILATAFHRNTLTNDEGGTNDEEFRVAAVVDRVNTTMQVWMGLTMGCAQCHDHKYDPLTQEEYYRIFAIFNQTEDADKGDNSPFMSELTPEQEKQIARLRDEIAKLEKIVADQKAVAPANDPAITKREGPLPTRFVRIELLGKGAFLHLAEVQVFAGEDNLARKGKASQVSTAFDGPAQLAIDGNTDGEYFTGKSVSHTAAADNPWWEVDLGKVHMIDKVVVWNRTDGGTGDRLNNWRVVALDDQRKPVWVKSYNQPPKPSTAAALPKTFEALDAAAKGELARYLKGDVAAKPTPELKKLDELKKQVAGIKGITTPIMKELPEKQHRKTHVLIRGNFLDKGKEVAPGVPAIFPPLRRAPSVRSGSPLPEGPQNRLDLAHWLMDPANPLTARVTVNRYWEQIFGLGLVETPEDWGIRGKLPTHPELLDWLALEFISPTQAGAPGAAVPWDVKRLLKLIVTSAAYRQSSRLTPELLARDPDNRLFTRGPRFRTSAEVVRDQALFASGLLSPKVGGPPARPARPKLRLAAAFGGNTDWDASPGDDKYRRGLYTEWRRTTPYPSMVTFDAPNRSVCTVNRPRTNTPLQALVTLNDPCYVEAAQALARRVIKDGGTTVEARVQYAFRLCLTRPPQEKETQRLAALYQQARQDFSKKPKEALALATEPLGPLPAGMDATEAAAWTVVSNVLLNLDEMFLKR